MAKIIPYQNNRFKPIDYKRADDAPSNKGQLNLFQQTTAEEATLLPLNENSFDLALKLDLKDDPTAERFYLKAIEKNENQAHALCNLGVLAAHKQNMTEAIDFFSKALVENPRHAESHFNLANVYFACRDYNLAILHYQLVNKISPDFADAYFNLGLSYLELEKMKEAHEAFRHYQLLAPIQHSDQLQIILKSLSSLI